VDDKFDLNIFEQNYYNKLLKAGKANQLIKEKSENFKDLCTEGNQLLLDHQIEGVGARLVHRHFEIEKDEKIIERVGDYEGEQALITKPDTNHEGSVPASWILDKENMHYKVFECTTCNKAKKIYEYLKEKTKFLKEFADLLLKYDLQELIALSILDRDYFDGKPEDGYYIERSYDKSSVVKYSKEMPDKNQDIETAWQLKNLKNGKYWCGVCWCIHC
jgi:hypothetical protein